MHLFFSWWKENSWSWLPTQSMWTANKCCSPSASVLQNHRLVQWWKRAFVGKEHLCVYCKTIQISFLQKLHDPVEPPRLMGPGLFGSISVSFQKNLSINYRLHVKVLGPWPLDMIGCLHWISLHIQQCTKQFCGCSGCPCRLLTLQSKYVPF